MNLDNNEIQVEFEDDPSMVIRESYNRQMCDDKVCYPSKGLAERAITTIFRAPNRRNSRPEALRIYRCSKCQKYHLTSSVLLPAGAKKKKQSRAENLSNAEQLAEYRRGAFDDE